MYDNKLWVEKYSPKTVDEVILPDSIKEVFRGLRDNGINNGLLLFGQAGTGKTTMLMALCHEMGVKPKFINASKDGNIAMIRTELDEFCSQASLNGFKKVVILDEADGLTKKAQESLRGLIEKYQSEVVFGLTCNFPEQIIEALKSRLTPINFNVNKDDMSAPLREMALRVFDILESENISYEEEDKKAIVSFIKEKYPDNRSILNTLQHASATGTMNVKLINSASFGNLEELVAILKQPNSTDKVSAMYEWVNRLPDFDPTKFFQTVYDKVFELIEPKSVPVVVATCSEYLLKATICKNPHIHLTGFLLEIGFDDDIKFR